MISNQLNSSSAALLCIHQQARRANPTPRKTITSMGLGRELPSNALRCIFAASPQRNQEALIQNI
jgi:hypothetical protein